MESGGGWDFDLGFAAHSVSVESAWLRRFGASHAALDAVSVKALRAGRTMGGVSDQPWRGHRRDDFPHCAHSDLWRALVNLLIAPFSAGRGDLSLTVSEDNCPVSYKSFEATRRAVATRFRPSRLAL